MRVRSKICSVIAAALLLLALLLVPGCGKGKASVAVRMGYLRNDLHQLAYYVAREKGFYEEEGVDVREGGAFNAGPEEMSAFSAGDIDMGYVGTAPAMTFSAQDMVSIEIVAQANEEGSSIVVRSGFEGADATSLKGRTVAVPGASTVQDLLLRMALEEQKMDPKDVNIITLKPPEMIQALKSGQIDAFVAWEPYPSMAVKQGAGRVLLTSNQIWPHHPCCMLVVDSGFLEKNPDAVSRVVAAHVRATKYIDDNGLEAADMAHMFTGQDLEVIKLAMGNIAFAYRPQVKGIEQYAVFLAENGIVKDKDPAGFARGLIDEEFLPGDG